MPDQPRKKLAVIGIGNVLYGDDGLGPRAIWSLQSTLPPFPSPAGEEVYPPVAGAGVRENVPDRPSADVGAHGCAPSWSLPAVGGGRAPSRPRDLSADKCGTGGLLASESSPIPPGVDLIDGGSIGLDLLEYLKDYERVIIIDAADMGLPPGTVRTFTPDDVLSLKSDKSFSLHSTDVLGVIALGRTLGETLADISIIAVQPEFVGPKDGLSDAVAASLGRVVSEYLRLVRGCDVS